MIGIHLRIALDVNKPQRQARRLHTERHLKFARHRGRLLPGLTDLVSVFFMRHFYDSLNGGCRLFGDEPKKREHLLRPKCKTFFVVVGKTPEVTEFLGFVEFLGHSIKTAHQPIEMTTGRLACREYQKDTDKRQESADLQRESRL